MKKAECADLMRGERKYLEERPSRCPRGIINFLNESSFGEKVKQKISI